MKTKSIIAVLGVVVIISIIFFLYFFFTTSPSAQIITDSNGNGFLVNALRTEPDFNKDTYDSSMIFYGTVVATDTAPEQILRHNQKYTIEVKRLIKGDEALEFVDVYALGGDDRVVIDDREKINLPLGDTGVFFLDWMPQVEGFYTFFGGPRGALVENNGRVRNWEGRSVDVNRFMNDIEDVLNAKDTRPKVKTLVEMMKGIGRGKD